MTREWQDVAGAYDASFGRLCAGAVAPLLDHLSDLPVGSRLLDLGTGTGALAAAAMMRGFRVDGVDVEPSMVTAARDRVPTAAFSVADATDLPYPDHAFDSVGANFVLNHVGDPRAAVHEVRRVLRPGGSFAATIWPAGVSAMNAMFNEVVSASTAIPLEGTRLAAELDFPRTEDGFADLLRGAGLTDVRATAIHWDFVIEPAALWRAVEAGIAVIGRTYLAQDRATRKRMRQVWDRLSAAQTDDGRLRLRSTALLAEASAG